MVFGAEYELTLVTHTERARAVRKGFITRLVQCVPQVTPGVPNLEGLPGPLGFMLLNGSRIYRDVGDFVEICSPEVRDPSQVVQWQRANEQILLAALPQAARACGLDPAEAGLMRASTDYAGHFCGMHASFETRDNPVAGLVEYLVPFLVSRFYACAGGLGPSGLTMTHKNRAVRCVASADTRNQRGIVCLRNESLSGNGGHRVHLTHADLCMTDLSAYLTIGCTALVIMMLEAGAGLGPCFKLLDPVEAIRQLDEDFTWSRPLDLACGSTASALDIQEHYLEAAEAFGKRAGVPWASEVTRQWRWALDRLRHQGPRGLSRSLDAYIKLALYEAVLKRNSLTLQDFSRWCAVLELTQHYLDPPLSKDLRGYLRDAMPAVMFGLVEGQMNHAKLAWTDLPRIADLHRRIIALDLAFHDVGPAGLYHKLRDRKLVDPSLVTHELVQRAMRTAPQDTRATARSAAIQTATLEKNASGNWQEVRTPTKRALLPDPSATTLAWIPLAARRLRR